MIVGQRVTSTKLAYVAGILDGEGTLILGKYRVKTQRTLAYRGYMGIANTHIPLLEFVQGIIGGRICPQNHPGSGLPCYALNLSTNQIRAWLPKLLPYLIVKRDQAEVLLAFLKKQADKASAPVSEEMLQFSEECYQKLKRLKKIRYEYQSSVRVLRVAQCSVCNSSFSVTTSHPTKKFCSRHCKLKDRWTRYNPIYAQRKKNRLSQVLTEVSSTGGYHG